MDLATYNLRDQSGYLIYASDDVEDALTEYDRRREAGEKTHFDDFGVTELRDRLTEQRRVAREAEKASDDDET